MTLQERLHTGPPILLDGAMGTELLRRGADVSLPLWSAAILQVHPEMVVDIHQDYVSSGAEILTANTFRTTTRTLSKVMGDEEAARRRARKLTRRAVRAARAAADARLFVAGSVAPLEDCYHPELFPGERVAEKEFSELARWLVREGVDLVLIETMGRIDEAECALKATVDLGCPRWVSFILQDEENLLGGEKLTRAAKTAVDMGADAVLVNCSGILTSVKALEHLQRVASVPTGIYPNLGKSVPSEEGEITERYSDEVFLREMKRATDLGVRIMGSCCGSGPDHTRILRTLIHSLA